MHRHGAQSRGEGIPNLVGVYNCANFRRDGQAKIVAGWAEVDVRSSTKHFGTYAQGLCTGAD